MWDRSRINKLLQHSDYKSYLKKIQELEAEREFCGHTMGHFLDVARLAQILNQTEERGVSEELIYSAALVHDIGRHEQYLYQIPHEQASVRLAEPILKDCGFSDEECKLILDAVARHREKESAQAEGLTGLLYRSDKMSRSCFACPAAEGCNWKQSKKNSSLIW